MLKKICITLLVSIGLTHSLSAQNNLAHELSEAKLKIVRASVAFLASDHATFKNSKDTSCSSCSTYDEMKSFVGKNKLTGATDLINHWRSVKLDTSSLKAAKQSLRAFIKQVRDTLTIGGTKPKRKALKTYSLYEGELKKISDPILTQEAPKPPAQTSPVSTKVIQFPTPEDNPQPDELNWIPFRWLALAELGIIVVLTTVLLIKWTANHQKGKQKYVSQDKYDDQKRKLEQALYRVQSLESENIELETKNRQLEEEKIQADDPNPTDSERQVELSVGSAAPAVPETPTTPTFPETKYARYADLGDGFSNSELLSKENDETIFDILILSPLTAEYRVSKNTAAQKYALANANYFLSKVCRYDATPSGMIITDAPGKLRLQGNKWQINEPAKISFHGRS